MLEHDVSLRRCFPVEQALPLGLQGQQWVMTISLMFSPSHVVEDESISSKSVERRTMLHTATVNGKERLTMSRNNKPLPRWPPHDMVMPRVLELFPGDEVTRLVINQIDDRSVTISSSIPAVLLPYSPKMILNTLHGKLAFITIINHWGTARKQDMNGTRLVVIATKVERRSQLRGMRRMRKKLRFLIRRRANKTFGNARNRTGIGSATTTYAAKSPIECQKICQLFGWRWNLHLHHCTTFPEIPGTTSHIYSTLRAGSTHKLPWFDENSRGKCGSGVSLSPVLGSGGIGGHLESGMDGLFRIEEANCEMIH